jgi:hypothetical protein
MINIARPIASSAAATVKMKIIKMCPDVELLNAENETRLMLAARSIISIEIRMLMMEFLLIKTPKTPIEKSITARHTKCEREIVIGIFNIISYYF